MAFDVSPIDVANATKDKMIDPRDKKTITQQESDKHLCIPASTQENLCTIIWHLQVHLITLNKCQWADQRPMLFINVQIRSHQ